MLVFVRKEEVPFVTDIHMETVGVGIMGVGVSVAPAVSCRPADVLTRAMRRATRARWPFAAACMTLFSAW